MWIATCSASRLRLSGHSIAGGDPCRDHHREEPTAIRKNYLLDFRFFGTEPFDLGDRFVIPRRGREDVKAQRIRRGHRRTARALCGRQEEGARADGKSFPIIVIQEAGLDGFWIHRVLQNQGIESYVVDPASIATSRRRRRAKTDRIDGEALVRALLAYKRGEPRVCAMLRAPTPEEEDSRRICRERKTLTAERIRHVNRIKGLIFSQGISGYDPLRGIDANSSTS